MTSKRTYHRGVDLATRFWAHVEKTDGCWLWRDAKSRQPNFNVGGGKFEQVYRVAYRLAYGDIPAGAEVCHTCDDERCVRPEHLFFGTHKVNMRDMMAKGRGGGQFQPKSHCKRGHAFTPENTKRQREGNRCRTCENAMQRAWRARRATRVQIGAQL